MQKEFPKDGPWAQSDCKVILCNSQEDFINEIGSYGSVLEDRHQHSIPASAQALRVVWLIPWVKSGGAVIGKDKIIQGWFAICHGYSWLAFHIIVLKGWSWRKALPTGDEVRAHHHTRPRKMVPCVRNRTHWPLWVWIFGWNVFLHDVVLSGVWSGCKLLLHL